jgi:hypothetical protein
MKKRADTCLKRGPIAGLLALLLCARDAGADQLAVTAGSGNLKSHDTNIVLLSYQRSAPRLLGWESSYDVSFGYWSGTNHNSALTVARVVRWPLPAPGYYVAATFGLGMVKRTTANLGTQGQFTLRLAFGRKVGKYDLSLGESHYSNGKYALKLGWHGPNTGEDFLTLMLSREF